MSDTVKRLRELASDANSYESWIDNKDALLDAANEIEGLRKCFNLDPVIRESAIGVVLRSDVSHWKFQAKAARLVLQMFVDEFDRSESCTIEPTIELIEAARFHTNLLLKELAD